MITNLPDQLKRDEGNVSWAYRDSAGFLTIGVGFLVDKAKGGGLYPEEIAFILQNRISRNHDAILAHLPWSAKLDLVRFGVLENMCYQMGIAGLCGFVNTLDLIQQGDYAGASTSMLSSVWAGQTPDRAQRLSTQLSTGVWQ